MKQLRDATVVRPGGTAEVERLVRLGGRVEAEGADISLMEMGALDTRESVTAVPAAWVLIRLGRRRVLIVQQAPEQPQPP